MVIWYVVNTVLTMVVTHTHHHMCGQRTHTPVAMCEARLVITPCKSDTARLGA